MSKHRGLENLYIRQMLFDSIKTVRRKLFVSFHHKNDETWRRKFEEIYGSNCISKSVQDGDIDPRLSDDAIRRKVRENHIQDSTVTVVLLGTETWKRKHVDWEISASIRRSSRSTRSGLLGILVPTHPDYGARKFYFKNIPERLACNVKCGYAKIYDWSSKAENIKQWVEEAFERRDKIDPDCSLGLYRYNKH